jgi:hypothetical protein
MGQARERVWRHRRRLLEGALKRVEIVVSAEDVDRSRGSGPPCAGTILPRLPCGSSWTYEPPFRREPRVSPYSRSWAIPCSMISSSNCRIATPTRTHR